VSASKRSPPDAGQERRTLAKRAARRSKSFAPGASVGRYVVGRLIGSGAMAAVYEARQVDLEKRVALKVLHAHVALRIDVVQRFVLEARAAARLSHPHVVVISDRGSHCGIPFFAMELLEGEPLTKLLARKGPLSLPRLAEVMLPVVSAVAAAHDARVLHRDLKPDNVFLDERRKRALQSVLLDFGISKVDAGGPAKPLTGAGELLGTPAYMSPEQVREGMGRFDARSDQYALGVMLHECTTGKLPFRDQPSLDALFATIVRGGAPPPSSFRPELPREFDAVVLRAMSVEPADRFPSVLELGRALLAFADPRTRAVWGEEFEPQDVPSRGWPAGEFVVPPADLAGLSCFEGIPQAEIEHLLASCRSRRLLAGSPLFDQGSTADSSFVVVSGEVELARTHGAETTVVGVVGTGALIGLSALWDDAPRAVSAVARGDTVALEIARAALEGLGATCPALVDRLHDLGAATAAERLLDATASAARLLQPRAPRADRGALVRLAAALGEWSVPPEPHD
jgi:serine/threonine protein kinase